MKYSIAALALLGAAAQAGPVPALRDFGTEVLATFDDRTAIPAVSLINPVGNYKGLNWKALDILQAGVNGFGAIIPQSGTIVAANGVPDTIRDGGISITAQSVKSFDLHYAYFGCVVDTVETAASVPQACTIAFSAYKKGQSEVYKTVNVQFNPSNPLISKMTKATFDSSFAGLDRVDVAVVGGLTPSALTGLLIDNVQYRTYGSK
ncbi:hypothetical protein Q7P36_003812 [Cladosporium allicinum]